jgi:8-oxo-dGTP pyrophosphatase MutT (NUDIX family)
VTTRETARIIVLDEDERLLLLLTHWDNRIAEPRWLTPGGGVDPGEDNHTAAVRELFEETGLVVASLGEPVWRHTLKLPDGHSFDYADATYYLLRTTHFEPVNDNWMPNEYDDVLEVRWFTRDELAESTDNFDIEDVRAIIAARGF